MLITLDGIFCLANLGEVMANKVGVMSPGTQSFYKSNPHGSLKRYGGAADTENYRWNKLMAWHAPLACCKIGIVKQLHGLVVQVHKPIKVALLLRLTSLDVFQASGRPVRRARLFFDKCATSI